MIEIKMTKCQLFLTEGEMISLLASNHDIWEKAIARGKACQRMVNGLKRYPNGNLSKTIDEFDNMFDERSKK